VRYLTLALVWCLLGCSACGSASAVDLKKGVASARYLASRPRELDRLHASWAYDWSWRRPPARAGMQWVPMVWGAGSVTPGVLAALNADRKRGFATDLLGFNEPDSSSQSNMSPQQAADLWPQLEATGLRLGAPAPTTPTDGWLSQFMALVAARHLRVDFLTVHVYQDFTDPHAVAELRRELSDLHGLYHRPIWVTEIGAMDISSWGEPMQQAPTVERARQYMTAVTQMLNGLRYVQRYAWFTDNCWSSAACRYSSLFSGHNRLTAMGRGYAAVT
jgi:hypothetical protein